MLIQHKATLEAAVKSSNTDLESYLTTMTLDRSWAVGIIIKSAVTFCGRPITVHCPDANLRNLLMTLFQNLLQDDSFRIC